jgi:hypothetical protein
MEYILDKYGLEPLIRDSGYDKMKSHVHCFPTTIALVNDTNELYKVEFNDFFQFLRLYEQKRGYVIHLEDNRSRRYGKVKSFPCYCCAVTTATLVAAQAKD